MKNNHIIEITFEDLNEILIGQEVIKKPLSVKKLEEIRSVFMYEHYYRDFVYGELLPMIEGILSNRKTPVDADVNLSKTK